MQPDGVIVAATLDPKQFARIAARIRFNRGKQLQFVRALNARNYERANQRRQMMRFHFEIRLRPDIDD